MDTLIARFVTYIEEEAPKRGEVVADKIRLSL